MRNTCHTPEQLVMRTGPSVRTALALALVLDPPVRRRLCTRWTVSVVVAVACAVERVAWQQNPWTHPPGQLA